MANWCDNEIIIIGEPDEIDRFKETANSETEVFDINNFVPMPEDIRSADSPNRDKESAAALFTKYGSADPYGWACRNWGTRSGTCASGNPVSDPDRLVYTYQTMGPPLSDGAINQMSRQFPTLRFEVRFAESGVYYWRVLRVGPYTDGPGRGFSEPMMRRHPLSRRLHPILHRENKELDWSAAGVTGFFRRLFHMA